MECLKPNIGTSTVLESPPEHLPDIGRFKSEDILAGTIDVLPLKRRKWNVPWYHELKVLFEISQNIDRKSELMSYYGDQGHNVSL